MTAIVGIVDHAPVDLSDLTRMLDGMGQRGPAHRIGAASGQARLGAGHLEGQKPDACIGLPGSRADAVWLACADCRLDNADVLRRKLDGPPRSGAALILDAYRHWGEAMMEHIEGDFAFAIWDPDRQRLFFGRDRFGVKPFFYLEQPGRFLFASEVKGLLALPGTPKRVPRVRLAEFIAGHSPPESETFFADVRRLPPGSIGEAGEGVFSTRRYWRLTLPPRSTEPHPAEAFRSLFEESVRQRIDPDRPTVSMLSGGLDSSSISLIAARLRSDPNAAPLPTLSMVFPGRPEGDEQPFIDALLAGGRYAPGYVRIAAFDPFAGFSESLSVQDGLVLAPALTLNRDLYRAVPSGGIMLSGHGGDEVVSKGDGHLNDLARAKDWKRLWQACGGVADLYNTSRGALFWSLFERFGPGRYKIRALRRMLASPLSASLAPTGILAGPLDTAYGSEFERRASLARRGRTGRALDMATLADPMQAHALEILDRESSHVGIESRHPFFDERLVRFSLSLDPSTKLKDGWTRMLLREAMGDLPEVIRWRRDKHDFSPVIVRGMLTSPAASKARFKRDREALSAYVDLDRVEAARARLEDGTIGHMSSDAQALWRTTAVAEWIDHARNRGFTLL